MKMLFVNSIMLFVASILLMSCMGQSSNPLEKYADLKTGLPTVQVSETQHYVPDVFTAANIPSGTEISDLKLQGPNEVNTANFIEGKEGILYFKVLPKSTKITQYAVEITDFPISPRPIVKVLNLNNMYGIQWTPPAGVIPAGQSYITLQLKIKTTVVEATDLNLKGMYKNDILNLYITKTNSTPKILGRTNLDAGLDEGQTQAFTMDVDDPASAFSPKFPEIQITPYVYSNTEAFRADGTRYITMDNSKAVNPERLGESKTQWRFYFILQVDQLPLDRDRRGIENPLAPSVDVCFHVRAISVLQTQSPQLQICYKGRYAAQLPVLTWENDALKEVKAGITTTLKFKILSGNNLGEVSLKDAVKQVSGLTGKKDLICTATHPDQKAVQDCELTWTPTCLKTPLTKKLSLKIDNQVGKKSKSQSFVREWTIVPSEDNCQAPAATVKIPAKPSKSKSLSISETPAEITIEGVN